jgi:hypothetical protein
MEPKARSVFSFWHRKPIVFVSTQWTTEPKKKNFCFLLFRWILCAYFAGAITYSYQISVNEKYSQYWFIFLSHWGLVINLFSMLFSALAVTIHHSSCMEQKSSSLTYRVCWFFSNISTGIALLISIVYWSFMYDGKYLQGVIRPM